LVGYGIRASGELGRSSRIVVTEVIPHGEEFPRPQSQYGEPEAPGIDSTVSHEDQCFSGRLIIFKRLVYNSPAPRHNHRQRSLSQSLSYGCIRRCMNYG
jgi:hypothetical protein